MCGDRSQSCSAGKLSTSYPMFPRMSVSPSHCTTRGRFADPGGKRSPHPEGSIRRGPERFEVGPPDSLPAAVQCLLHLGQDASDTLGWTVSSSAVIRALIQYVGQRPSEWAAAEIRPLIEQETA